MHDVKYCMYDQAVFSQSRPSTVMRIIEFKTFPVPVRLHSSYGKFIFVIISLFFAIFKNIVHSFEPGETPIYSASHQAQNYAQRS